MINKLSFLSVILLVAFLGGCSSFSSPNTGCMKVMLISTLSRAPLYQAIADDPRAANLAVVKSGCGGENANLFGAKERIDINLQLTVPEAKKRTDKVKKVAFPVFVALLDGEDNVIDRYDEKLEVNITGKALNHKQILSYHPPQGIDIRSDDHRILVGFNGSVVGVHSRHTLHPVVKRKTIKKK